MHTNWGTRSANKMLLHHCRKEVMRHSPANNQHDTMSMLLMLQSYRGRRPDVHSEENRCHRTRCTPDLHRYCVQVQPPVICVSWIYFLFFVFKYSVKIMFIFLFNLPDFFWNQVPDMSLLIAPTEMREWWTCGTGRWKKGGSGRRGRWQNWEKGGRHQGRWHGKKVKLCPRLDRDRVQLLPFHQCSSSLSFLKSNTWCSTQLLSGKMVNLMRLGLLWSSVFGGVVSR